MDKLQLVIVTPCEKMFEGEADRVLVRTVQGDVAILPRHIDYACALASGDGYVNVDGKVRPMHIDGGLMYVRENHVRILANHFEWRP